ncbi:alpha/beta hydrolase [Streptomyces sp. NPDC092369]|uniref:alpha/beta hydrolase n=1 Tax=Streptomyces sp. NPDC092369 TaxID=3366015 RepID=UPI003817C9E2
MSLDEVLLGQVRYRDRGWNEGAAETDALRALSDLGRLAGNVPVILLGHAMGGRTALRAAVHPQVLGVVALAPRLPACENVGGLAGRSILLVQGEDGGTAARRQMQDFVQRARTAGARAGGVVVLGGGPWMARRASTWHGVTAAAVRQMPRPHAQGPHRAWSSPVPVVV